jgi:hypothetical protein
MKFRLALFSRDPYSRPLTRSPKHPSERAQTDHDFRFVAFPGPESSSG